MPLSLIESPFSDYAEQTARGSFDASGVLTVSEPESYLDLLKRCLTASIYDESGWQLIEGPMLHQTGVIPSLKRSIVAALAKRGIRLVRTTPMNQVNRDQGLDWPLFGFTMTGTKRIENLQNCLQACLRENVPGDFVETGVWRGGSCILAKAIF
jgi:O-methyltransferase